MNIPNTTWDELQQQYQDKTLRCGSYHTYNPTANTINDLPCDQWICKKCRKHLVAQLYENTLQAMYRHDLQRHIVLTFQGKQTRTKYNYEQSYRMMNNDTKNLIKTLKYKLKKEYKLNNDFAYIRYPRAQTNGYCHQHIILNNYIDKQMIDHVITKNKYIIGYTSINYNEDLADYLRDFKKDHEYYIPYKLKHYSTSRNIIINVGQGYKSNPDNMIIGHMTLPQIEETIYKQYNQNAPWEIYVKWFHDVTNTEQPLLPGTYINGILKYPAAMHKKGGKIQ